MASFEDDNDTFDEKATGTGRILALSDGVFAVVITLLVLEIKAPDVPQDSSLDAHLLQGLLDLWPSILSYIISFLVVGTYWRAHHRIFQYIKRYDTPFLRINMLLLLSISFIPLPTAVIGH